MPNYCHINETKSNIDAAWNTNGNKFCVGGSSGYVFIGIYVEEMELWVTQAIRFKRPLHI
jgi:hypothetical protein